MNLIKCKLPAGIFILFTFATILSSCRSHKGAQKETQSSAAGNKNTEISGNAAGSKKITAKYSDLLAVPENQIDNISLYNFIDEWYGVPYKYGGKNKSGIDCSNFTSTLYKTIYNKSISGSSSSIFNQCNPVSRNELREGDLLFFKIENDQISHIGVYLKNNRFVHATTKKGVMIDDLNNPYYKKYFFKAGRTAK
ncbi:MAG: glycoside hydrolase [Bacteroidota bacterium]|jgi:lipoprotein Spr|nr:glycoside hydrolase [Bacteroidota bacterium]